MPGAAALRAVQAPRPRRSGAFAKRTTGSNPRPSTWERPHGGSYSVVYGPQTIAYSSRVRSFLEVVGHARDTNTGMVEALSRNDATSAQPPCPPRTRAHPRPPGHHASDPDACERGCQPTGRPYRHQDSETPGQHPGVRAGKSWGRRRERRRPAVAPSCQPDWPVTSAVATCARSVAGAPATTFTRKPRVDPAQTPRQLLRVHSYKVAAQHIFLALAEKNALLEYGVTQERLGEEVRRAMRAAATSGG